MSTRRGSRNCANRRLPIDPLPLLRQHLGRLSPTFRNNYLKDSVFKKFVSNDTDPPEVRRQRALQKWFAAEQSNGATNVRLLTLDPEYNILPRVHWSTFRDFVVEHLTRILGAVPPDDILLGGHSGGATTSRLRASGHPALKFVGKAHVTERALDLAIGTLCESRAWIHYGDVSLELVSGNVLFTVPKSTEIDRCACKEPDLNMFMQRGVGSYIRKALRREGIDLNDQSRNRDLARVGSIDGSLATLDLSSASDSITRQLVAEFLPVHWYQLLDSLRSPSTTVDGVEHTLEMFSSMGNGFTFELESLLFYSIARAVAYFEGIPGIISVYGDDIIVPTDISTQLIWVLSVLGFETNVSKSFTSGTFRESCGGHYDGGRDVTPFYVRRPVERLTDLIELLNKIYRWSRIGGINGILDPELFPVWNELKSLVPSRLWGGMNENDIHALVTGDLPRSRLVPISKPLSLGIGTYIHRLFVESNDSIRLSAVLNLEIWNCRRNEALVDLDVLRAGWPEG